MKMVIFCLECCLLIFVLRIPTYAQDGSSRHENPREEVAFDLDWRFDGSVLAVGGYWNLWFLNPDYEVIAAYPHPLVLDDFDYPPQAVEWSPDGRWIAVNYVEGYVRVWAYPSGELVFNADLSDRERPDTIRWHPIEPLLSTYDYIINLQTGTRDQPYTVDVYAGRTTNDPPIRQQQTGGVFWSPDGSQMIRVVSEGGCNPCSEYGVFDTASGELIESLGLEGEESEVWAQFVWSEDGRYRMYSGFAVDMLFRSDIERMVTVESGNRWYLMPSRMPALLVTNTFFDSNVVNNQVAYPVSILRIDWTPNTQHGITALNCGGEILSIDIVDMSIDGQVQRFAQMPFAYGIMPCANGVIPGDENPFAGYNPYHQGE